jgi:hypothetical protein
MWRESKLLMIEQDSRHNSHCRYAESAWTSGETTHDKAFIKSSHLTTTGQFDPRHLHLLRHSSTSRLERTAHIPKYHTTKTVELVK